MLARQNLSRRHEGYLVAVMHHHHRSHSGHNGFARTDIAFNETIHRMLLLHMKINLIDGFVLVISELEWQMGYEIFGDFFFKWHSWRVLVHNFVLVHEAG